VIRTPDPEKIQPLVPAPEVASGNPAVEKLDIKLYKSLSYLSKFEFIEKDGDGLKMRLKNNFGGDSFPFEIGYTLISDYDDRRFLVSKVDPENSFLWFGLWEE
jgi:hypothetical protein